MSEFPEQPANSSHGDVTSAGQVPHQDTIPATRAGSEHKVSTSELLAFTVKETSTAVMIALVLAFIFRGFVIEAFVIPTGSMAPTLLGSHMRFTAPSSGYSWAVGPWDVQSDGVTPLSVQGGPSQAHGGEIETGSLVNEPLTVDGHVNTMRGAVVVHDPMTGEPVFARGMPTRWGDRIFVLKYLYSLFDPSRWEVVVFRNPRSPTMNYIKRLIGLPGEMVAILDGDVFIRTPRTDDPAGVDVNPWKLPGWAIQRKSEQAQAVMWQTLYSSEFAPLSTERNDGSRWFLSPWVPVGLGDDGQAWTPIAGERGAMRYAGGPGTSRLIWNVRERAITDSYAYNESPRRASLEYPVSDVRLSAGVTLREGPGTLTRLSAFVQARRHTFRCDLFPQSGKVMLMMGEGQGSNVSYTLLKEDNISASMTRDGAAPFVFAFSHVDQRLEAWINGERIAAGEYNWDLSQRVKNSLEGTVDDAFNGVDFLTVEANYLRPQVWFEFEATGAADPAGLLELRNISLARDVHYQADIYRYQAEDGRSHSRARTPALATHPRSILTLGADEFFVCGDNSPQSLDGRLWDQPHPLVAKIDPNPGVVHRDLLIGRAFLVYLPAPARAGKVVLPDLGRTRFIR
jgi:signal peptidase I